MPDSRETISSGRSVAQWVLIVIGLILATTLLVCCGAPLTLFLTMQPRQADPAARESAKMAEPSATAVPLRPRELLDWYRRHQPDQPFVYHDETLDNVDLRGTILEINRGSDLRVASTADKYRKRVDEMDAMFAQRYANAGEAQLVFHGDQDNQEVICWFKTADMIEDLAVGQEVVVRGRKLAIAFPIVEHNKDGPMEKDGGFSIEMQQCQIVSP